MLNIADASNRERAAVAAFAGLDKQMRAELRKATESMVVPAMRDEAGRRARTTLQKAVARTARLSLWKGTPGVAFGGKRAVTAEGMPAVVVARATEWGSDGRRYTDYLQTRKGKQVSVLRRVQTAFMPDSSTGKYVTPAAESIADDVLDKWVTTVEDLTVRALDQAVT